MKTAVNPDGTRTVTLAGLSLKLGLALICLLVLSIAWHMAHMQADWHYTDGIARTLNVHRDSITRGRSKLDAPGMCVTEKSPERVLTTCYRVTSSMGIFPQSAEARVQEFMRSYRSKDIVARYEDFP